MMKFLVFVCLAIFAVQPSHQQVDKCKFVKPKFTCDMYIGENVVYDSKNNLCTVQTSGCSASAVAAYAFASIDECKEACLKPEETVRSDEPVDKCSYEKPEVDCQMYIGQNIVYDSKTNRCIVKTGGCSMDALAPYKFATFGECRKSCVKPQENVRSDEAVDKCSYQKPEVDCQMYIGQNILYDSLSNRCFVKTGGCSASIVAPYKFDSFTECQNTCVKPQEEEEEAQREDVEQPTVIDRCSYDYPEITCMMYIGENIVYNKKANKCTIQTSGCSASSVAGYRFATMQECYLQCVRK